ncbi:valyl-tRNA synthetase [Pilobolus umbonatus]|nr:valyl-tRNA synthetase [Pilobolus umbonatus]
MVDSKQSKQPTEASSTQATSGITSPPVDTSSSVKKVTEQAKPVTGKENQQEELDPAAAAKKAAKEAKNEEKRLAKMAKFAAKQAKLTEAKKAPVDDSKSDKKKKATKAAPAPAFVNKTPKGSKKVMSELASAYDPRAVESAWYDWWVAEGFFKPEFGPDGKAKPEGTFVIPVPPPNVTGSLHIGHALTVAIQDTLIRWNRMLGKTVLYNPGMDHAGISCQSVVEKKLWHEKKITRHDLGREKFVESVWEWKEKYGNRIRTQFERLGTSFDWDRDVFTMDAKPSKAVRENFIRLHRDGIIYRANRLVNWCVTLNTALSNLEVENKELAGRTLMNVSGYDPKEKFEFGVLNEFAYEVEGSKERLVVATTRIETMLGDTAVAVHPEDKRYTHLHGKFVVHPFLNRRIPIVTDDIAVDMAFGTGAVKITPAHDFNDYEVGKRHNLEFINLLNDDGTYNENAGPYKGMKRFHVRNKIIEDLKAKGLFVDVKNNPMTVPVCSKSGDIIEPLMKPQWWVKCKGMADKAMKAVTDGELKITPKVSEGDWFRWLNNINDWCISRQLWWGHRIPAYFVNIEGETHDGMDDKMWVSGHDEKEARLEAERKFPGKKFTLEQDPDVLDTWFSSGLWPFSILGWPDKTPDYEMFYPATVLETGWDILFFWVARMVMLGIQLTGKVPFSEVICHAMIRDAHGRKMSKSLGNVIDPIDVIEGITLSGLHQKLLEGNLDPREVKKAESGQKADFPKGIPECGTDALRFALCAYTTGGRDINLDISRVEGYRKFCNKLWNATRFALMKLGDNFKANASAEPTGNESIADKWILSKLNKCAIEANKALEERNFMAATNAVYQFWLYELCDVYIEVIKPICDADTKDDKNAQLRKVTAQNTLYTCLEAGLKLMHPFMPFVTEELYQHLGRRPNDSTVTIVKARYPVEHKAYDFPEAEDKFDKMFETVKSIRSLAVQLNQKKGIVANIQTSDLAFSKLFEAEKTSICALIKGISELSVLDPKAKVPENCESSSAGENVTVYVRK